MRFRLRTSARPLNRKLWLAAIVTGASSAMALAAATTASASSNNQVVLSATGIPTTGGPGGFWIWSQPGGNAYGNEGAGSIYFYALLPAEHPVDVSDVSVSGNTVSEKVTSTDGLISCPVFTGTETTPGHGTVTFSCNVTTPSGKVVTAAATDVPAQVNISTQAVG
jgi:hypothetical protein